MGEGGGRISVVCGREGYGLVRKGVGDSVCVCDCFFFSEVEGGERMGWCGLCVDCGIGFIYDGGRENNGCMHERFRSST